MSTVIQFPPGETAPLADRVSGTVRSLMGRYRVSQVVLAKWIGIDQTSLSARLRGETEWKLSDIESVAAAFAVHPAQLMGGSVEGPPHPDGGIPILSELPRLDSNQQPFGSLFAQVRTLHRGRDTMPAQIPARHLQPVDKLDEAAA